MHQCPQYIDQILNSLFYIFSMTSITVFVYEQHKSPFATFEPFYNTSIASEKIIIVKVGGATLYIYLSRKTFFTWFIFSKQVSTHTFSIKSSISNTFCLMKVHLFLFMQLKSY